jgi:TolC family type I secretion outer membrane protein
MKRLAACLVLIMMLPVAASAQSFEEAMSDAYATNPDLGAARAALRGTDEQVPQALANWRPTVTATGTATQEYLYTHPSAAGAIAAPGTGNNGASIPEALVPPGHQALRPYTYGVQITQPLYRGGRTTADTSRAENTILAGRAQLATTEQTVLLNAGTAYMDVLRDQSTVDLEVKNDQALSKIADAFQKRLHVGEVTRTDVAQAEAQRGAGVSTRMLAQSQLATSRANFQRYVGVYPESLQMPELAYPLPPTQEETMAIAEENNPQVLSATYTEAAARDSVDLAHGAGLPELDLIGQGGRTREGYAGSPPIADGTIEAQLNIPLYAGGLTSSQVRQAKQVANQRLIEIEAARRQARQQAIQAWQTLDATTQAIAVERQSLKAAEQAYEGARQEEQVGTKSTLDLLSTLQVLLSAGIGLATTEHDEQVAKLGVLSAIGQLTAQGLNLPVDQYDPVAHYADVHDSWGGEGIDPETMKANSSSK